jgi:nicotine blue oxidoreductase
VLAAGSGTRLGRGPKALLPWNGEVLVTRAARAAVEAGCTVTVAVGPAGRTARSWLRARCPAAQRGRRCTTRTWACPPRCAPPCCRSWSPTPHRTPVVVLLVDQPGVDAAVIRRLLAAHVPGRVTARCGRRPGQPSCSTPATCAPPRPSPPGTRPRAWIARNRHLVDDVECGDLGRGDDIDEPADLVAWPELRVPR